jgi:hypothetical protein
MRLKARHLLIPLLLLGAAALWLAMSGGDPAPDRTGGVAEPAAGDPARAKPASGGWLSWLTGGAGATKRPEESGLEGTVVDARTGAPVPGAELTFSLGDAAATARAADGRFLFKPPFAGTWRLAVVTASGYLPFAPEWGYSPVAFDAAPGRLVRGVVIRLNREERILGRVLSPEGKPVAGADVRLLGAHLEAKLVPIADRFTSDANGEFTFSAPEGTTLEASAEGFLPGWAEVDFLARASGKLTVRLQPRVHELSAAAPIAGRVADRRGGAVAGALVTASRELGGRGGDATAAAVLTGADGAFALPALDAGWWRITARAAGRVAASARRVRPGTKDLLLTLDDGGRLRGCASDAATGAPIVSLTVHLLDVRSTLRVVARDSRAVIDPSGCWALDDIAPGPVRVVVSAPGYAPSSGADVTVPEAGAGEAVADARLSTGARLTGVVRSEGTGGPIAGARVALEGQLESAASALPALAEATTDEAGRFTLTGLPRRASIFVAAAGHHARILSGIEAAPGAVAGPVDVALRPTAPGEEPRLDLAGVGVLLAPGTDGFTIAGVVDGAGASRAGLQLGDVVVEVDGRRVTELGMQATIEAIRGPEGTSVMLTYRRGDRTEVVRVTRSLVRG